MRKVFPGECSISVAVILALSHDCTKTFIVASIFNNLADANGLTMIPGPAKFRSVLKSLLRHMSIPETSDHLRFLSAQATYIGSVFLDSRDIGFHLAFPRFIPPEDPECALWIYILQTYAQLMEHSVGKSLSFGARVSPYEGRLGSLTNLLPLRAMSHVPVDVFGRSIDPCSPFATLLVGPGREKDPEPVEIDTRPEEVIPDYDSDVNLDEVTLYEEEDE